MLRGRVTGSVVSTRKVESLVGCKLMEVAIYRDDRATGESLVAVDAVGAGIGEDVLVTTGSAARLALERANTPTDAVIVGIVDR